MAVFREWVESRFKGLIDLDGVDKQKLGTVYNKGKFYHIYKNGTACKSVKITASQNIIPRLEQATKRGYFSLLFNSDEIIIIFHQRVFKFPRKNFKSNIRFRQAMTHAREQKIPVFYMNELEDTLWN